MGTQLAAFRALRQTQKHAADMAAQLAQAGKDAAHQRQEREKEAQAFRDALDAAGQQTALRDAALREIKARVQAQTVVTAEATALWTHELQRATERAETQRAAAAEATRALEAEQRRAAALEERLTRTVLAASRERAESDLLQSQEHILQLCELRAAACAQVEAAWIAGVQAGRLEAHQQVPCLPAQPEQARGAELTRGQAPPEYPVELPSQPAFAVATSVLAPAPETKAPCPPRETAQPVAGPGALGRRTYAMLEKAMKRS